MEVPVKIDLIIDGYNLLHAAGFARRSYGPGDLARCRLRLLNLIAAGLDDAVRPRTTVVFDGKDPPPDAERYAVHRGMQIFFAEPGEEADDLIEDLIAAHSSPKQLLVVSSDRRLQRAARRRKAHVLESEPFVDDCERRRGATDSNDEPAEPLKPQAVDSPEELEQWLNEFGEIDIEQLRSEIGPVEETRGVPEREARTRKKTKPAADAGKSDYGMDELAFWEDRLSDLLEDEPG
ncbi:MAG: hypothetical protein DWQ34_26685 [Planctomycetota bacterium]|nr:MAG: hypothetical protein DWQ34_26685 [Planctomycetota bacterium]REK22806.1 MAG: hypothetical protein DWQ41_18590 [Planctomycetota bacterium]REK33774.1 MAG: hypothetical protein DWQ45_14405 [Planctomycetota bacterium]